MLTTLLRQSAAGLRVLLVMTVLLGLAYPFAIYGVSRIPGLHAKAEGSLVEVDGRVVGSELIAGWATASSRRLFKYCQP
ncbi:MAG: potassium-transporting ATPase subunit C, partial [Pseudonocardiaceae bacterium]